MVRPEAVDAVGSGERCEACGGELAQDQEWCLDCGAARTLLRAAPDWRIPAAIVALLVAVAIVATAAGLAALSI
jgi:hypothetical protein